MNLASRLRETWVKAFSERPEGSDADYKNELAGVSLEGPPDLTLENHTLYLGKVTRSGFRDQVRAVLGGFPEGEQTYSFPILEAALREVFKATKAPDEPVQIYLGRYWSELFNGEEGLKDTLSVEDQVRLLRRLAKKIGEDPQRLVITDVKDVGRHTALMKVLEASTVNGKFNPDLFSSIKGELEGESLVVAKILFDVLQENEELKKKLIQVAPKSLRQNEGVEYYALFEVALHIADVLSGATVHSGVSRQKGVYALIRWLLNPQGQSKTQKDFQEKLKSKYGSNLKLELNSISVVEKPSTLRRLEAQRAQRALIIGAVLNLGSCSGAFIAGQHYNEYEAEKNRNALEEKLDEELSDLTFYFNGPVVKMDKDQNVGIFMRIVDRMEEELSLRYPSLKGKIGRRDLIRHLLENKFRLQGIYDSKSVLIREVDLLVQGHQVALLSEGVVLDRPYAHFNELASGLSEFPPTADCGLSVNKEVMAWHPSAFQAFSSTDNYRSPYGVRCYAGTLQVSDSDFTAWSQAPDDQKEFLEDYVQAMERYDIAHLEWAEMFFRSLRDGNISGFHEGRWVKAPDKDYVLDPKEDFWRLTELGEYKDYYGRFHYELAYHSWQDEREDFAYSLVARRLDKGETHFSTKTAREAAQVFLKVHEAR